MKTICQNIEGVMISIPTPERFEGVVHKDGDIVSHYNKVEGVQLDVIIGYGGVPTYTKHFIQRNQILEMAEMIKEIEKDNFPMKINIAPF